MLVPSRICQRCRGQLETHSQVIAARKDRLGTRLDQLIVAEVGKYLDAYWFGRFTNMKVTSRYLWESRTHLEKVEAARVTNPH